MSRIAVYRSAGRVWYDSLAEVVEDFTTGDNVYTNVFNGRQENRLGGHIGDVVLYNVRYRDICRAGGADALYMVLFREAPALKEEKSALRDLERALDRWGKPGNYDIQCLSVDDSFSVHGHVFNGLDDVRSNVEWFMHRGRPFRAKNDHPLPSDVRILCDYMPYPVFDSSDWGDNRDYCNYFFKAGRFDASEMDWVSGMPITDNYSKAHERLTCVDELSLLYCDGDSDSMLLVTPKSRKDR